MEKIVVFNLGNLPTAPVEQFNELQRDFKLRNTDSLIKLKDRILEAGFKYSFKAWRDEQGTLHIIDAHQRRAALLELQEDGYEVPPIPYELIQAANKKEAIKEIAYINSTYGDLNPHTDLFEVNDIDLSELGNINLDFMKLEEDEDITEAFEDAMQAIEEEKVTQTLDDPFNVPVSPVFYTLEKVWESRHKLWCKYLKEKIEENSLYHRPALLEILVRWFNTPYGEVKTNFQYANNILRKMGLRPAEEDYDLAVLILEGSNANIQATIKETLDNAKPNTFTVFIHAPNTRYTGLECQTLNYDISDRVTQLWNNIIILGEDTASPKTAVKNLNEARQLTTGYYQATVIYNGLASEVSDRVFKILADKPNQTTVNKLDQWQ